MELKTSTCLYSKPRSTAGYSGACLLRQSLGYTHTRVRIHVPTSTGPAAEREFISRIFSHNKTNLACGYTYPGMAGQCCVGVLGVLGSSPCPFCTSVCEADPQAPACNSILAPSGHPDAQAVWQDTGRKGTALWGGLGTAVA